MKPLNLDNRPCSPTSSDCVIWSGKDLPCINLCAGDSVTDVVFKLATELCTIMDQLNITNYDLSCFNLAACPPADFQALIQFLIEQICLLQGVTTPTKDLPACPDCVVSVAACFIVGTQTTMQLIDYVNAIAERVCSIIDQITVINNEIANLTLITEDLQFQIDNLPTYTLPSIEVNCTLSGPGDYNVIGGGTYAIDLILQALVNDPTYGYCSLLGATGLPTDMLSAVAGACITASSPSIANPASTMGAEYSPDWINSPVTIADTIVNLWISLCDIRTYLESLSLTVVDTNTVNLTYSSTTGILQADVQDTGWWPLKGFEFYDTADPASLARPECRRIGNVIYFRGQVVVPLNDPVTGLPLLYNYKTGNDSYLDVLTVAPCLGNGGVLTNNAGSVIWNFNAASGLCESVIPIEVLPAGRSLDANAYNGWKFAFRSVRTGSASSILNTLFSVAVLPDGRLIAGLVKYAEESTAVGGAGAYDTCPLNYIISHVTLNDKVPKFTRSAGSLINGNPTPGLQDVRLDFDATEAYPFSCNANDEDEVGAFKFALDGIMGHIDPCEASIPSPEPC